MTNESAINICFGKEKAWSALFIRINKHIQKGANQAYEKIWVSTFFSISVFNWFSSFFFFCRIFRKWLVIGKVKMRHFPIMVTTNSTADRHKIYIHIQNIERELFYVYDPQKPKYNIVVLCPCTRQDAASHHLVAHKSR